MICTTPKHKSAIFLTVLLLLFQNSTVFALAPENHLADEAQEQRALKLFLEVRCLVCQGQVIENSNTEFSFEMRKLIRQKIADGKNNAEIKADLIQEFGADILVYSDFGKNNFLLWLLPSSFAVLLPLWFFIFRNRKK